MNYIFIKYFHESYRFAQSPSHPLVIQPHTITDHLCQLRRKYHKFHVQSENGRHCIHVYNLKPHVKHALMQMPLLDFSSKDVKPYVEPTSDQRLAIYVKLERVVQIYR